MMAKEIKHLKVTCDHCGCAIDPDNHSVCPKCGASYDRHKLVERYNELQDEMNEIHVETARAELESLKIDNARKRQQMNNNYNRQNYTPKPRKTSPVVITIVVFVCIVVFAAIFGAIRDMSDTMGDNKPNVTEATPAPIVETPTEVGFNESAELIQYSVICDKVEEYYYPYDKPQEGFRYLRMHLIITNKTDKDFRVWESMKCTYMKGDYEINAEANTIHSSDLNTKIYRKNVPAHASAEGWVYFEVPADTNIKLYCGEYVTINLSSYTVLDGEPLNVGFNEPAETKMYTVVCDEVKEYKTNHGKPADGFIFAQLHLIVSNTSNDTIKTPMEFTSQHEKDGTLIKNKDGNTLGMDWGLFIDAKLIDSNETADGIVCFEIPIGEDIVFTYNEYITIRIPFENVIRID